MDKKRNIIKLLHRKCIACGIFSLAVIAFGIILIYEKYNYEKNYETIDAIVERTEYHDTDDDIHYDTYVRYEYKGIIHSNVNAGGYDIQYNRGKVIRVCVNKETGKLSHAWGTVLGGIAVILFGTLILVACILETIEEIVGLKHCKRLKETGIKVYGKVDKVYHEAKGIINRKKQYSKLTCVFKHDRFTSHTFS